MPADPIGFLTSAEVEDLIAGELWDATGIPGAAYGIVFLRGELELGIPGIAALTLAGTLDPDTGEDRPAIVAFDFKFPAPSPSPQPEDPELEMNFLFDAGLSANLFGGTQNIGIANGAFHATVDFDTVHVDPVLGFEVPNLEIWGAAILQVDLSFLESVGLFATGEALLRINTTDTFLTEDLTAIDGTTIIELPENSFALRVDGEIDFRVLGVELYTITGIFVMEFSPDQGFNVAIFGVDDVTGEIEAAALRYGPDSFTLFEAQVQGLIAIRETGIAASLLMSFDAGSPLSLIRMEGLALFVLNTIEEDVTFNIPGGASAPNGPTGLSLTIPKALPADPIGFLTSAEVDDLIAGELWDATGIPGAAYGIVFLRGELELGIPGIAALTLAGTLDPDTGEDRPAIVAFDFKFPAPSPSPQPEDPELEMNFLFDAGLSANLFGSTQNIGIANGAFHATVDFDTVHVDPVLGFEVPNVEIWGAAIVVIDASFLESVGLFVHAGKPCLRINTTDTFLTEDLTDINGDPITIELLENSFALRVDGEIDFRVLGVELYTITGIFVMEFSPDQGFNVAIFGIDDLLERSKPPRSATGPTASRFSRPRCRA